MIEVNTLSMEDLWGLLQNAEQLDPEDLLAVQVRVNELTAQEEIKDVIEVIDATNNYDNHWVPVFQKYRENYSIVYGDQFSAEEKVILRNANPARPETVHNKILPKVLQFAGALIGHSRSIEAFPQNGEADDEVASRFTKIFKHIEQNNNFEYLRYLVGLSGFITRVGWYYLQPPPENATGDELHAKIRFVNAELVEPDPDISDIQSQDAWKGVIFSTWMSVDDMINTYPSKADIIKSSLKRDGTVSQLALDRLSVGINPRDDAVAVLGSTANVVDMAEQRMANTLSGLYRVVQFWERKTRWVDSPNGNRIKQDYMQLRIVLPYLNIRLARYDLPQTFYPFFPNIPIDIGGSIIDRQSAVDQMVPLQQERNRLFALWIKISRRSLAKTLVLAAGEGQLQVAMIERGDESGIFESATKAGEGSPVQAILDPAVQVGEIERLLEQNDRDFQEVSFVVPAVAGQSENSSESGSYYNAKLQQGEQGLAPFFYTEWKTTMPMLYKALIEYIQLYYTEEMTFRIIGVDDRSYEDVVINQYDPITDTVLNDVTQGKYGVFIDDTGFSSTANDAQAMALNDLIGKLPQGTPPQVLGLLLAQLVGSMRLDNRKIIESSILQYFGVGQPPMLNGAQPSGAVPQGAPMP